MSDTASVTSPELEAAQASIADLETIKDEKDATIAELTAAIEENGSVIAKHVETEAALRNELNAVKAKLTEAEVTIRTMTRTEQASKAGVPEDKIANLLEKFNSVDDEAFAAMLELVSVPEATPEVVAEVVEVEVEEEVVAEELDDVEHETEAALNDIPEELTNTIASTANFFRSVLKTTKNLK